MITVSVFTPTDDNSMFYAVFHKEIKRKINKYGNTSMNVFISWKHIALNAFRAAVCLCCMKP